MGIVDVKVVTFFARNPVSGITKVARENWLLVHVGRVQLQYNKKDPERLTSFFLQKYTNQCEDLRDDIKCGIESCTQCIGKSQIIKTDSHPPVVPDADALITQIDFFVHPAVKDVIILQTVLESIKMKSLVVYKKIMCMKDEPEKRMFMFYNMFHYATYCNMNDLKGTTSRDVVALIKACAWYKNHMGNSVEPIIISGNDVVKNEAQVNSLNCITVSEFLELIPSSENLVDILTVTDCKSIMGEKKYTYSEHLTSSQIGAGLKSGALYSGKLEVEPHNIYEGNVICKINGEDQKVLILGRENMNRGMDGDIVAVNLLKPDEFNFKKAETTQVDDSDDEDELQAFYSYKDNDKVLFGKIVGVMKRIWGVYCGNLNSNYIKNNLNSDSSKIQALYFFPNNKKIPKIRIGTRQSSRLMDKKIAVSVDSWPRDSKYPLGHYIKTIGQIGDKQVEVEVLLMENNINSSPFSQKVLSCLPPEKENWTVQSHHLVDRQDYRDLTVFSIDPPGSTDIDDALHCRRLPDGHFEIGIHIADVSYFVKPDTPLDLEAKSRATTVYLIGERIDMIPSLLGSNLCSIRQNVDRLSVSCVLKLDNNANVIDRKFCRSVIRSRASLTYEQASLFMSTKNVSKDLIDIHTSLNDLHFLAKKLRALRKEAGALNLASSEMVFELGEDMLISNVTQKEMYVTNWLIEEFMLLANTEVAKKIQSTFKRQSLLRRHPTPPRLKFDSLIKAVETIGFKINVDSSKALSDSLDNISKKVDPYIDRLIRIQVTRCTPQALYFSSGSINECNYWHYGLALPIYTHFTSPIRRYPDIIVHRILLSSIGQGDVDPVEEYPPDVLSEICDDINKKHYQSKIAAMAHANIVSTRFFLKAESIEEGYIVRIMSNCFSVSISKFGVEGIVNFKKRFSETRKNIMFDLDKCTITANNAITLKLFDKVKVKIDSNPDYDDDSRKRNITLSLIEPYIEEFSADPE